MKKSRPKNLDSLFLFFLLPQKQKIYIDWPFRYGMARKKNVNPEEVQYDLFDEVEDVFSVDAETDGDLRGE